MTAIAAGVALGISGVVGGAMMWAGSRLGLVDRPDDAIKTHARPVPPLGGVGVVVGIVAGAALAGTLEAAWLVPVLVVLALGFLDDRLGLGPVVRLAVEVGAGALLAALLAATGDIPLVTVLATPILTVVAVNAVNLFDGLDGLVGGTGSVAGLGIWLLALARGGSDPTGLLLAAALVGFLVWNWHPAKLFLGDGGSYAIGLTLVYAAVRASESGAIDEVLIGFAMLGVILLDLALTVLRRLRDGRPLFVGDRSHLYDQMVARGKSVPAVAVLLALLQAAVVLAVFLVDRIEPPLLALFALTGGGALFVLATYRTVYQIGGSPGAPKAGPKG